MVSLHVITIGLYSSRANPVMIFPKFTSHVLIKLGISVSRDINWISHKWQALVELSIC